MHHYNTGSQPTCIRGAAAASFLLLALLACAAPPVDMSVPSPADQLLHVSDLPPGWVVIPTNPPEPHVPEAAIWHSPFGAPNYQTSAIHIRHQFTIFQDSEQAAKRYAEWEANWFPTADWIAPPSRQFQPRSSGDAFRLACIVDLTNDVQEHAFCRLVQQHGNVVVLLRATLDSRTLTVADFIDIADRLDERLQDYPVKDGVTPTEATGAASAGGSQTDQQWIAFDTYNGEYSTIFRISVDGSQLVQLTPPTSSNWASAWSPDGQRIAFTSNRDGPADIYVMDRDGGNVMRLTDHPALDAMPAWSPDGTQIAFMSQRDGASEVYVMQSDGTQQQRLTHDLSDNVGPKWSPTGEQITYMSRRNGPYEVYVMNADGTGQQRMTDSPPGTASMYPSWSPSGDRIAFVLWITQEQADIYTISLDRLHVERIIGLPAHSNVPAWSPDGQYIAFQSNLDGDSEIFIASSDGKSYRQLTHNTDVDTSPSWSP